MIKKWKIVSGERVWSSGVRRRKRVQLHTISSGTVQLKYFIYCNYYLRVCACVCMCICIRHMCTGVCVCVRLVCTGVYAYVCLCVHVCMLGICVLVCRCVCMS